LHNHWMRFGALRALRALRTLRTHSEIHDRIWTRLWSPVRLLQWKCENDPAYRKKVTILGRRKEKQNFSSRLNLLQKWRNGLLVISDPYSCNRIYIPFSFHDDWYFRCFSMDSQEVLVLFDFQSRQ
jgi:hypothetical protein